MGLFDKKQTDTSSSEEVSASNVLADADYLKELRSIGREQFKEIISKQAAQLEKEVGTMMQRVTSDMKVYTARRVDELMGRLNADITNQLNERMREYNRVSGEAQELVAQSLSRNAQTLHEKYQELSLDLQRVVANQEVMMTAAFQDNKTKIESIEAEQGKLLEQLRESEAKTQREVSELTDELRQAVTSQSEQLNKVYQENIENVEKTRDAQAEMLETLTRTTKDIEQQHQQLRQLLDESVAKQREMVAGLIDENMARIIEHYLIAALGEQSNLREQLPAILERMEENKQAMADDMKL